MPIDISQVSFKLSLLIILILFIIILPIIFSFLINLLDFISKRYLFLVIILSNCNHMMWLWFNLLLVVLFRGLTLFFLNFIIVML
jgi:hypothetical protein